MKLYSKQNIIFISPESSFKKKGAREALACAQALALGELDGLELNIFPLRRYSHSTVLQKIYSILGYIDGVTKENLVVLRDEIKSKNINTVYLDGSNLGLISRFIKKNFKSVRVVIFFHNVEARFFFGSLKHQKNLKSILVLIANYFAERCAVAYSDIRIMLNKRDSDTLRNIYGYTGTHICPFEVPDQRINNLMSNKVDLPQKYCLFVGSAFYANVDGISWFCKYVAPYITIKVVIIGRGFEKLKSVLETFGNIDVLGEVEDLSPWYNGASFVIAPIFDGSGMKTKVGEALMYGKKVVGSREAFTGYEEFLPCAGILCEVQKDYIAAISKYSGELTSFPDTLLQDIYNNTFSHVAFRERLWDIINTSWMQSS